LKNFPAHGVVRRRIVVDARAPILCWRDIIALESAQPRVAEETRKLSDEANIAVDYLCIVFNIARVALTSVSASSAAASMCVGNQSSVEIFVTSSDGSQTARGSKTGKEDHRRGSSRSR
jgi:hypothetical protein